MHKWKLTILLMANAALMYSIFILSLQEPKSKAQRVYDVYGDLRETLNSQEREMITLATQTVQNPTTVTIEQIMPAYTIKREIRRSLKSEDAAKLIRLINGGN